MIGVWADGGCFCFVLCCVTGCGLVGEFIVAVDFITDVCENTHTYVVIVVKNVCYILDSITNHIVISLTHIFLFFDRCILIFHIFVQGS